MPGDIFPTPVYEILDRYGQLAQPATREDVARLEAKLDALILALKAGAIGRWQ